MSENATSNPTTDHEVILRAKAELKIRQGKPRDRLEELLNQIDVAEDLARPRRNDAMRPHVVEGSRQRALAWKIKFNRLLHRLRQEMGEATTTVAEPVKNRMSSSRGKGK